MKKRHTSLFSGIWREIRKKIHQKFAEKNAKFEFFAIESMKFINSIAKTFWRFLTKKLRLENGFLGFASKTVQRSAFCRSRREHSNEYLLAKIGVDTAENEPLEVWGKIFNIIHWCPYRYRSRGATSRPQRRSPWLSESS